LGTKETLTQRKKRGTTPAKTQKKTTGEIKVKKEKVCWGWKFLNRAGGGAQIE